jgi:hypothetical protein
MFDQLSDDILASLIKGFPRTTTTTTTKQNVDPAVYYVYSQEKMMLQFYIYSAIASRVEKLMAFEGKQIFLTNLFVNRKTCLSNVNIAFEPQKNCCILCTFNSFSGVQYENLENFTSPPTF